MATNVSAAARFSGAGRFSSGSSVEVAMTLVGLPLNLRQA
jgi:hypothetical protein